MSRWAMPFSIRTRTTLPNYADMLPRITDHFKLLVSFPQHSGC